MKKVFMAAMACAVVFAFASCGEKKAKENQMDEPPIEEVRETVDEVLDEAQVKAAADENDLNSRIKNVKESAEKVISGSTEIKDEVQGAHKDVKKALKGFKK